MITLIPGGLEIPVEVTVHMNSTPKNIQALEKYKFLVAINYKEPVDGKYDDCTKQDNGMSLCISPSRHFSD